MEARNLRHVNIKNGVVEYSYTTKESLDLKKDTIEIDELKELDDKEHHEIHHEHICLIQNKINQV